jgi:hypothetical protein
MKWVRVDTDNRRVWILGARIHHGLVGLVLTVVGTVLMIDDWHDHWWITDNE